MRSLLFAPADTPRKLERAWQSSADAVIADLEDAVPEARKDDARRMLAEQARSRRPSGDVIVRINALDTKHAPLDLELIRSLELVDAVLIPKARSSTLRELPARTPPVIALVETSAGVIEAGAIASMRCVIAQMIGTIDLAAELGVDPADDRALLQARSMLVLASAAAGLPGPIDGVWTSVADIEGLRAEAWRSRSLGYSAKACIHPEQLGVVNEIFMPTTEEVERASELIHAAEKGLGEGRGVIVHGDCMVDRPVVERARRILETAATHRAGGV